MVIVLSLPFIGELGDPCFVFSQDRRDWKWLPAPVLVWSLLASFWLVPSRPYALRDLEPRATLLATGQVVAALEMGRAETDGAISIIVIIAIIIIIVITVIAPNSNEYHTISL